MKAKYKQWFLGCLASFLLMLLLVGSIVVIIDPYFHYHGPVSFVRYKLDNERYQNDGILRHFDYDAIITGTSMTQCFKPSELNSLFDVTAVKVPYSGASYKEISDSLTRAISYNPEIKMIIRTIDADFYFQAPDSLSYTDYPTYLYDNNPFNDVSYVFNKDVIISSIQQFRGYLSSKDSSISLDAYSNWSDYFSYGKEEVLKRYNHTAVEVADSMLPITEEEQDNLETTIEQNFISLARENPDIEFYYYFPPYSICYYDYWNRTGVLEKNLLAEQYIIEQMLNYENIHVFAFSSNYDVICNLDNYKDPQHHSGSVNSQILQWMRAGQYQITADNYETYCKETYDFYMNYNYDSIYE